MNFFHIPNFEDHYNWKIWLKNWNLKLNKKLFYFVDELNKVLNDRVSKYFKKNLINEEIIKKIIYLEIENFSEVKFQIYFKDEYEIQNNLNFDFYSKMHFLFYLIEYNSSTNEEDIEEYLKNIYKVSYNNL